MIASLGVYSGMRQWEPFADEQAILKGKGFTRLESQSQIEND